MQKTIKFLFIMGFFTTVIQQFPYIKESVYNIIRGGLYGLFGFIIITKLLFVNKRLNKSIVLFSLVILIWSIMILLFVIFGLRLETLYSNNDVLEIYIPWGILLSSFYINFNEKDRVYLMLIYSLLTGIMGISNILYYSGKFELSKTYILGISKNQIGPMMAISCIYLIYHIINKNIINNKFYKIIALLMLFCLNFVSLIIIRNRAGLFVTLISIIIISFIRFIYINKYKKLKYATMISIVIALLYIWGPLKLIAEYVYNSFTINYNLFDLNNFSSNRIDGYIYALNFVKNNYLLGQLISKDYIDLIPHNYLLNKLMRYGIIGCFPLLFIYIYFYFFLIKEIKANLKMKKSIHLSLIYMLSSLIISITEYTYPFGPGVSQIVVWWYLGQYMSCKNSLKYLNNKIIRNKHLLRSNDAENISFVT